MRLTVVGCSGSVPGPDSPASCYLVEADGFRLLLDAGSGALGALQRVVDPLSLDAVLLSHLHGDHCLDLCGLYVLRRYGPAPPAARLPVHGPAATAERMARAYDLPAEPGISSEFSFTAYPAGPVDVGPFRLRTARVAHPVEAYALRLEHEGRALVYSGDTGATDALVDLARDADLLLCEAAWGTQEPAVPDLHLSGRQAGEHASMAGVGRLVVTHVPPWQDAAGAARDAAAAFDGPVEPACGGLVVDV